MRLSAPRGNDGSYIKTAYDNVDKSTQLHYKFNGQRRDVYFNYDAKDNLPLNVKFGANSAYSVANTYDALTRLTGKSYAVTGSGTLKTTYKYHDWASNANHTTGTVEGIDYTFATFAADGLSVYDRWYGYDAAGNIVSESMWSSDGTNTLRQKYTYDSKNQLIRHDSATKKRTTEYVYDAAGNITAKKTYAYTLGDLTGLTPTETITYGYSEGSWHDLLTSYNGQAITYDAIGNPINYRGWTMSWQGRQLESAAKDGNSLSFTYDSEGVRTSKTVGNVKTSYLLNGTQILAQTTNGKTLCFFYDQQGNRVAMADGSNHIYYYLYNLQGDVIAIADSATGKLVATYTYDAWGKCTVQNATGFTAGTENPFRYRGYYYDSETGLYYLQSRYYDAETGRFINADNVLTDTKGLTGFNLFSYCGNDPVNRSDPSGMLWKEIGSWLKKAKERIEEYLSPSNVYGSLISGASIISTALASSLEGAVKTSKRPNNIGAGTYAKQCKEELQAVSRFKSGASRALSIAAYGAAAIDVGIGIRDNINNGASAKKIILDATVDVAITGGSIWAAGMAGGAIGTAVGTVAPGIGNVVGAGTGFIIGIGIYVLTDMTDFGGKSARAWAKEGVNSLW